MVCLAQTSDFDSIAVLSVETYREDLTDLKK